VKIFITGITGFVGGAMANYFASLGYEITGIGRSDTLPPHISNNCNYLQANICKPLPEIEADIVIHAAGLASDTASFKELYAINVEGTQNVLAAAKKVNHFIYVSSSSVYNFHEHAMTEIEGGLNYEKLSGYGKSKFLAEQHVLNDSTKNKKTLLRPRAIYGRHDLSLLPRLMKLVKGNRLFLPAHVSKKISLTHIDNFVQAVELCVENQTSSFEIFNVADNEVYDLYKVLTKLLPLVASRKLQTISIPAALFDLFVAINSHFRLNPSFNQFAADSLTKTAMMNTCKISQQLHYNPGKNFYNSYPEIGHWIHQEGGWKYFFKTIHLNAAL
jgi:nucleoside-diphosphate-sugar epimerase